MWSFLKENYPFIGLLIGILGVAIAIVSLIVEVTKRRKK